VTTSAVLDKLHLEPHHWLQRDGYQVPAYFDLRSREGAASAAEAAGAPIEEEYWAFKEAAALTDLSHRGKLLVRGKDAARFLHGMVTNEIKALEPGHGAYAFFVNVHGQIQADCNILRIDADSFWIDCLRSCTSTIQQTLEKYIIMEDVEVLDLAAQLACIAIEGPCSLEVLRSAIGFEPPHMLPLEHLEVPDLGVRVARTTRSGEFGYWLWGSANQLAEAWQSGLRAGRSLGARPVGHLASDICRIEAGVPRYGTEITDKTLPQETGQLHAISYTKGCYLGQEIVERVRSRGQVHRKLVGLLFEGKHEVAPGAELRAVGGDSVVGTLTSAAYSFGLRRTIALGMVRRESADAGTFLQAHPPSAETDARGSNANGFAGSGAASLLEAEVASLPFFYPMARSRTA
jgi:folate-binding protein YgfZ